MTQAQPAAIARPLDAWRKPLGFPPLEAYDVHVWRVPLDLPPGVFAVVEATLEEEERERAWRFAFGEDCGRFIAARGLLRILLSQYTGIPATDLRFASGGHGKPHLEPEQGGLRFNLSHTGGTALMAVARYREVGVDIEAHKPGVLDGGLAERFFAPEEIAALHGLPGAQQMKAFFDCWTRKESYVKAKGSGLTVELDQFHVSLGPGEQAALRWTAAGPDETNRWTLENLDMGKGYSGALCVEGRDCDIQAWQWPPLQSGS